MASPRDAGDPARSAALSVTVVGCGAALDPDLPNTSLLYRGPRTLLLDCGYAVPHAFWRVSQDPDLLDGVWISHIHADHAFGLPALIAWMKAGRRQRPLAVLGAPGVEAWLWSLLDLGYPGSFGLERCFPIHAYEVSPAASVRWEGLHLRVAASVHRVPNLAVRIDAALPAAAAPLSVAYSGDGVPTPQTEALFAGADLLIHEAFRDHTVTPAHATAEGVIALAERGGVRQLALVHVAAEERAIVADRVAAYPPSGPLSLVQPAPGDVLHVSPR